MNRMVMQLQSKTQIDSLVHPHSQHPVVTIVDYRMHCPHHFRHQTTVVDSTILQKLGWKMILMQMVSYRHFLDQLLLGSPVCVSAF